MRVYFYCPDRHIVYSGASADETGVGGGITVRLRMAAALASLGHTVTMACNCLKAATYGGVRYVPLDAAAAIDTDVLVAHSSGGNLDVSGISRMPVAAQLRILAVEGLDQPRGSAGIGADYVYGCSNFLADVMEAGWHLPGTEVFVSHHGVKRAGRGIGSLWRRRDPRGLIYSSHPSKGLDTAIGVTRELRKRDARFHLDIYGGDGLWGGHGGPPAEEAGVRYHGLVGQSMLLRAYARAGFALHLQKREEPFGISLAEAMAAGCLVVASPVGAYREIVEQGRTGILIQGDPESGEVRAEAAASMLRMMGDRQGVTAMRRRAEAYPLDWSTVAKTWEGHWRWAMAGKPGTETRDCRLCGAAAMVLADGLHCGRCKRYSRSI